MLKTTVAAVSSKDENPLHKDVFISYGRAESLAFVARLHQQLRLEGLQVWFDKVNIPHGEDYQFRIDQGICFADNFLFIIAPHALRSTYCLLELQKAISLGKRIFPILHIEPTPEDWEKAISSAKTKGNEKQQKEIEQAIKQLQSLDWIYAREEQGEPEAYQQWRQTYENEWKKHKDPEYLQQWKCPLQWKQVDSFSSVKEKLLQVLQENKEEAKIHTQLLQQALKWEQQQKDPHLLLTGKERSQAEQLLITPRDQRIHITTLLQEYLSESRKNAENCLTDVFLVTTEQQHLPVEAEVQGLFYEQLITFWVHTKDLATGVPYQEAVLEGIEGSNVVLCFISSHTIQSEFWKQELEYALSLNKKVVPLMLEKLPESQLPTVLQSLTYIDFRKSNSLRYEQVLKAIQEDRHYLYQHKVLLTQALKWERQGKNESVLLKGFNLQNATLWQQRGRKRDREQPLELQEVFISESERYSGKLSTDVFLSYSRSDSDFTRKLNEQLQYHGRSTWFDQENIAATADFEQEIKKGIRDADNFVFVITKQSVHSPYCLDEVHYAERQGKRILTLLLEEVDPSELPKPLQTIQWIDARIDFDRVFGELLRALSVDQEYVSAHGYWQGKAVEWEEAGQTVDHLLLGEALQRGIDWLAQAKEDGKRPAPTDLQESYILECKHWEEKRKGRARWLRKLSVFGVMALLFMTIFGAKQWWESMEQFERLATEEVLRKAEALEEKDPALSSALSMEVWKDYEKETEHHPYAEQIKHSLSRVANKPMKKTTLVSDFPFGGCYFTTSDGKLFTMQYLYNTLVLTTWGLEGEQLTQNTYAVDPEMDQFYDMPEGTFLLGKEGEMSEYNFAGELLEETVSQERELAGKAHFESYFKRLKYKSPDQVSDTLQTAQTKVIVQQKDKGIQVSVEQKDKPISTFSIEEIRLKNFQISFKENRILFFTLDKEVVVWDITKGHLSTRFTIPYKGQEYNPFLAFSPDGKHLAMMSEKTHQIYVWEVPPSNLKMDMKPDIMLLQLPHKVTDAALTTAAAYVATFEKGLGTGNTTYTNTFVEGESLIAVEGNLQGLSVSPNARFLLGNNFNKEVLVVDRENQIHAKVKGELGVYGEDDWHYYTFYQGELYKWNTLGQQLAINKLPEGWESPYAVSMAVDDRFMAVYNGEQSLLLFNHELKQLGSVQLPIPERSKLLDISDKYDMILMGDGEKVYIMNMRGELLEVRELSETITDAKVITADAFKVITQSAIYQKTLNSSVMKRMQSLGILNKGLEKEAREYSAMFAGKLRHRIGDSLYIKRVMIYVLIGFLTFMLAGQLLSFYEQKRIGILLQTAWVGLSTLLIPILQLEEQTEWLIYKWHQEVFWLIYTLWALVWVAYYWKKEIAQRRLWASLLGVGMLLLIGGTIGSGKLLLYEWGYLLFMEKAGLLLLWQLPLILTKYLWERKKVKAFWISFGIYIVVMVPFLLDGLGGIIYN
ncbi:TIR domain-containing protein [Algivirga pacifica]|uniref:TIR domain-containing protein n=1 Tax=Algivirga pacifica TaxID=1162670 RepID=A0ABP9DK73_9BACT